MSRALVEGWGEFEFGILTIFALALSRVNSQKLIEFPPVIKVINLISAVRPFSCSSSSAIIPLTLSDSLLTRPGRGPPQFLGIEFRLRLFMVRLMSVRLLLL